MDSGIGTVVHLRNPIRRADRVDEREFWATPLDGRDTRWWWFLRSSAEADVLPGELPLPDAVPFSEPGLIKHVVCVITENRTYHQISGALAEGWGDPRRCMRTAGQILGFPPVNQSDASTTPMFDCFTDTPDFTPFVADPHQVPLDALKRILWHARKGSKAPSPQRAATLVLDEDD